MKLQTISQVSKLYNVSTRTLRYYEEIGLINSIKTEDYAYRTYDEKSMTQLKKIIILKKLRIPLKEISEILKDDDVSVALEVFEKNLITIMDEVAALSTVGNIIHSLIDRLKKNNYLNKKLDLLTDENMLEIVNSMMLPKNNLKEDITMSELNKANESLSKLKDVRIIYLPPATVAASHYVGENPEDNAGAVLNKFILESGLCDIKPDLRHYGFNHPNPTDENSIYGYEMWVTIPDDMEVPKPLIKKKVAGGLYAAHMIAMGNFHEWQWLNEWVTNNDIYESNSLNDNGECMHGLLEEHLNYINLVKNSNTDFSKIQLDLLYPIKEK